MFKETSIDAFKDKRILEQMYITLDEVTVERNMLSDQNKSLKMQVDY